MEERHLDCPGSGKYCCYTLSITDPFNNLRNFRTPASLPAFVVSPTNGNLYIAWADYRHGDSDIFFTSSTNGGTSWSTPVRLNDDPLSNGIDQFAAPGVGCA